MDTLNEALCLGELVPAAVSVSSHSGGAMTVDGQMVGSGGVSTGRGLHMPGNDPDRHHISPASSSETPSGTGLSDLDITTPKRHHSTPKHSKSEGKEIFSGSSQFCFYHVSWFCLFYFLYEMCLTEPPLVWFCVIFLQLPVTSCNRSWKTKTA